MLESLNLLLAEPMFALVDNRLVLDETPPLDVKVELFFVEFELFFVAFALFFATLSLSLFLIEFALVFGEKSS